MKAKRDQAENVMAAPAKKAQTRAIEEMTARRKLMA